VEHSLPSGYVDSTMHVVIFILVLRRIW